MTSGYQSGIPLAAQIVGQPLRWLTNYRRTLTGREFVICNFDVDRGDVISTSTRIALPGQHFPYGMAVVGG